MSTRWPLTLNASVVGWQQRSLHSQGLPKIPILDMKYLIYQIVVIILAKQSAILYPGGCRKDELDNWGRG